MSKKPPVSGDYEVGFGRPPKEHRFQKGQSGNPSGRRKGSLNAKTVMENVFSRKVPVEIGGRRETVPLVEAVLMLQAQNAVKGEMKSATLILGLFVENFSAEPAGTDPTGPDIDEDKAILDRHLRKHAGAQPQPAAPENPEMDDDQDEAGSETDRDMGGGDDE